MGKLIRKHISELLRIMYDKTVVYVYLFLKKVQGFPKCIIKFLIENYITEKHLAFVPLRNIVTFTNSKSFIGDIETSKTKSDKFLYNYYEGGKKIFTNRKTVTSESLIVSHRHKKVHIDSYFSVSQGYTVARFKPGYTFLHTYIKKMVKLLLDLKSITSIVQIKNLKIPDFDSLTQRFFIKICKQYSLSKISRKLFLKRRLEEVDEERDKIATELIFLSI
jgi:hypothetical protein